MGIFAENLNLGNRVRPPLSMFIWMFTPSFDANVTITNVTITIWAIMPVVVVLRSPIHANEPSEYNGMLYRTSNRVLNNGIKVIILICMDGTSQYHHHHNARVGDFYCCGI